MSEQQRILPIFFGLLTTSDVFAKSALTPEASEALHNGLSNFVAALVFWMLILIVAISLGTSVRSKISRKSKVLADISYGLVVLLGIYMGSLAYIRLL
ncbi:hypothetical protein PLCT1_00423 [Planctomycetaceae bacterium]|nr:hypothetical protein PLCT1_00423 [Planctomycetaceae bacterium]